MPINLSIPREYDELKPRITVVGVGGAGGNAVNNMIRSNLFGCEFVACNTDAQALHLSQAERKIQLGVGVTRGLGAGSQPDVGRAAAEEALEEIIDHLTGSNMVFITAGMGGGTGTGAAPVIARAARESGILTVGVVTKPFHFEGTNRMRLAERGIEQLQQFVDTLIIIPNQNLFRIANDRTTFAEAFKMADDVLHAGVRGVTDLMVMPGLINLDFADIRTVMGEMGKAMMGTGEAEGERRATEAAEAAISNPLLDDVSMKGAKGVLINITGGADMTLFEVDEAANRIRDEVDPDANIIFGSTFDEKLDGRMRISVVATGIGLEVPMQQSPYIKVVSDRSQPQPAVAAEAPTLGQMIRREATAAAQHQPVAAQQQATGTHGMGGFPGMPASMTAGQSGSGFASTPAPQPSFAAPSSQGAVAQGTAQAAVAHEYADPALQAPAPVIPPQSRPAPEAAPARTRGPNLFQRMTGGMMRGAAPAADPAMRPSQPSLAQNRPQAAPPAQAQQPRLGGFDDRAQPRSQEDLLDIPAFLRRQAN